MAGDQAAPAAAATGAGAGRAPGCTWPGRGSEVLAAQPPNLRSSLLETASILSRLYAQLRQAGSATLLERIERSNLFLVR